MDVSRERPTPAKRGTRSGDVSPSVGMEIESLRHRLEAAQEAERAALAALVKRLSDAKRLAGTVARESQPTNLEPGPGARIMAQSKCGFCQGKAFTLSIEHPSESDSPFLLSDVRLATRRLVSFIRKIRT